MDFALCTLHRLSLSLSRFKNPNPSNTQRFIAMKRKSKADSTTEVYRYETQIKGRFHYRGSFIAMKRKSNADSTSSKLSVKKGGKSGKKEKDPNKPKRPPSAFFVFMEGFRKEFKEKNPSNKSVAVVAKAGGDKWKSMSDAEKAPFQDKADKRKKDYEKTMTAYNKKQAQGGADDDEESDKSKSEVHDEDDEEEGSEEEDED